MARDQGAFSFHLLGVGFADFFQAIHFGIGEFLPCVRFTIGFDAPRLRVCLGAANACNFVRFGFQLTLLDLALFEGQDMFHGFFLRFCRDDLFPRRRLGGFFAMHFFRFAIKRDFFHALVLELKRITHFFRG